MHANNAISKVQKMNIHCPTFVRWDKQDRKALKINDRKSGWRSLGKSNPCSSRADGPRLPGGRESGFGWFLIGAAFVFYLIWPYC